MSLTLASTTRPAGQALVRVEDQRDLHRPVVDEDAVVELFLLAERLAVVAGDDDERPLQDALRPQGLDDPPQLVVHERDLAVVEVAGEFLLIGRGRIVGHMGVEEMDPGKEPAPGVRPQPADERVGDLVGLALGPERLEHLVVVERSSYTAKPWSTPNRESTLNEATKADVRNPRSRSLSARVTASGARIVGAVVADLMVQRIGSRQDGTMGRERQRAPGNKRSRT